MSPVKIDSCPNNGSNRNYDTLCSVSLWYNPACGGVFSGISFTLNRNGVGTYQAAGLERC